MALALVLRCGVKPSGLQHFARLTTAPLRTSANLSLMTTKNDKPLTLVQKLNPMRIRSIALTAPRKSDHSDHSFMWKVEKGLTAALLGIIPAAFIMPSGLMDNLLVISLVLHQHWGIEAVVVDYIRPVLFGATIPVISHYLVYVLSIVTLGSLLYFNYKDVGFTKAVKQFWALKAK